MSRQTDEIVVTPAVQEAMHAVSSAAVVNVPIANITIGTRRRMTSYRSGHRRRDRASLKRLAHSIDAHGLINPILLCGDALVAGHRRLEACRLLKWITISARQVEPLSDDERRAIELDENTMRENFSTFERSLARLTEIRQSEVDLKARAEVKATATAEKAPPISVSAGNKQPTPIRTHKGRPRGRTAGSKRDIAEATGISPAEQVRAERHVAVAEQYPFMQGAGWLRRHVLAAGAALEQIIPSEDRAPLAVLVDQSALPPETAIKWLTNAGRCRRRGGATSSRAPSPPIRRNAKRHLP